MTGGSPGQRAGPDPAGGVLDTRGIRPCVSSPQWTQAGGGRPRARGSLWPGAESLGSSDPAVQPAEQ